MNKTWTSLVQTGCCWRFLNRHMNIITVNHTGGCWSSLNVLSLLLFWQHLNNFFETFWQPFSSWGHTWRTSSELVFGNPFSLRAHLKNFFETFFDNPFFPLLRAHLKDVFETWGHTWGTSLKFFGYTFFFLKDLHLRDFWGFALWLDRVIFRVFKDGIMEVGFFTFDFFFIFIYGSSIFFLSLQAFLFFFSLSLLNLLTYFQFHLWELLWFSLVLLTCFPFSFFSKVFHFFLFFFSSGFLICS